MLGARALMPGYTPGEMLQMKTTEHTIGFFSEESNGLVRWQYTGSLWRGVGAVGNKCAKVGREYV